MAENALVRETTRNTSPRGDKTVAAHTAKKLPAEGWKGAPAPAV
jgi:hypothetical protein